MNNTPNDNDKNNQAPAISPKSRMERAVKTLTAKRPKHLLERGVDSLSMLIELGTVEDKDRILEKTSIPSHFFNKIQKNAQLVTLGEDGRLMRQTKPLSTAGMVGKAKENRAAYVYTTDGKLYVFKHGEHQAMRKQIFHSAVNGAQTVLCSGMLEASDGKITFINTDSGHYKPLLVHLYAMIHKLPPHYFAADATFEAFKINPQEKQHKGNVSDLNPKNMPEALWNTMLEETESLNLHNRYLDERNIVLSKRNLVEAFKSDNLDAFSEALEKTNSLWKKFPDLQQEKQYEIPYIFFMRALEEEKSHIANYLAPIIIHAFTQENVSQEQIGKAFLAAISNKQAHIVEKLAKHIKPLEDWTADIQPNPHKIPVIAAIEQRDHATLKTYFSKMSKDDMQETATLIAEYGQPADYLFFVEHASQHLSSDMILSSVMLLDALKNDNAMYDTLIEHHGTKLIPHLQDAIEKTADLIQQEILSSSLKELQTLYREQMLKPQHAALRQASSNDGDIESGDEMSAQSDSEQEDLEALFANQFNSFNNLCMPSASTKQKYTISSANTMLTPPTSSASEPEEQASYFSKHSKMNNHTAASKLKATHSDFSSSDSELSESEDELSRKSIKLSRVSKKNRMRHSDTTFTTHSPNASEDERSASDDKCSPKSPMKPTHTPTPKSASVAHANASKKGR